MASGTIKSVVPRSDIVNNLTTNDSTKVLSAAQGKALKDIADTLSTKVNNVYNKTFSMGANNTITITRTTQHQNYIITASSTSHDQVFIVASNGGIANLGSYGAAAWSNNDETLTIVINTYRGVTIQSDNTINYTLSTTSGTFTDNSNWKPYSKIDGIEIPNNADLNDYKTPGTYYCASAGNAQTIINKPSAVNVGFTMQVYRKSSAYYNQVIQSYGTNGGGIFVRTSTSAGWQPWFSDATDIAGLNSKITPSVSECGIEDSSNRTVEVNRLIKVGNTVHISLKMKASSGHEMTNATSFTVPSGYRPSQETKIHIILVKSDTIILGTGKINASGNGWQDYTASGVQQIFIDTEYTIP